MAGNTGANITEVLHQDNAVLLPEEMVCPLHTEVLSTKNSHIDSNTRIYPTSRFGDILVPNQFLLLFPEGLIGFERLRHFVLLGHNDHPIYRWLQSLEDAKFALPVAQPTHFRPDYSPRFSQLDLRGLEFRQGSPRQLYVTLSVPAINPNQMTVNLLAPIVINPVTRKGKQVIVQNDGFRTNHEVLEEIKRGSSLDGTSAIVQDTIIRVA